MLRLYGQNIATLSASPATLTYFVVRRPIGLQEMPLRRGAFDEFCEFIREMLCNAFNIVSKRFRASFNWNRGLDETDMPIYPRGMKHCCWQHGCACA